MTAYRSFAEQARHYFIREHDGMPEGVVEHPAAWHGPDMAKHAERWLMELSANEVAEIGKAADEAKASGLSMEQVTADNFPLPLLSQRVAAWRKELQHGRGFICVRALPVERWREETGNDEKSALAYWGLGHHLGMPGAQNPQNELLGHVIDYDEEGSNPMVRRYRTSGNIDFHCDSADVVGLLCLRKAKSGGQSRIASSVAIYNEITKQRPDLAALLFEPFKLDRRGEHRPGDDPAVDMVPSAYKNGALSTFWHSEYYRSAPRHESVADYSAAQLELIALYDEIAASPEFHMDMWLEPGDMQFISNHSLVHARTGYEDFADRDERRHLLRLWLSFA